MQDISLTTSHHKIAGLRLGKSEASIKVLALHGWLDNAASFLPLSEYLEDIELVAIDLPGHGLSEHRSADANYHLVDWVQDVYAVLEALDWSQCHILGHSLGGIIGSLFSASFPERVQSLMTIEAFGSLTKDVETSAEQIRESVLSRIAIDRKPARHPKDRQQAVAARAQAGDLARSSAELLVDRNLQETDGEFRWRSDRRLRTISSLRMTEPQAEAFLSSIQCPVVCITGTRGFEKVKRNLERRRMLLTSLQHEECEGGHHLHMDNPSAVAAVLKCFLTQNSGR
ncbi:2-succinyl-6-hydroxy-2,4-cyclohexadiene-1-carboxylate synthase [Saliniradius amylolyticus]|uniref:2-succinyl-6-hydroxy-2, 4-cyclohexadiene-1-carboxylate synthase n=1 Tax=Saliniradius amylolyticus TaxID=2183582 RepID=A0A2S2E3S0_9ALTE|nr:alpha/beta hydrolase [Saliniradius amylolyticus]AWL12296.1 2-succinyl-6-hydroxy-2,4-cyclohexadiene-1-carboxylate synthase [Saliniradius amylolyticus]